MAGLVSTFQRLPFTVWIPLHFGSSRYFYLSPTPPMRIVVEASPRISTAVSPQLRGLPADGRFGVLRALRVSPYAIPALFSAFAAFALRLVSSSRCSEQGSYSVPDNSKGQTPTISDRLDCANAAKHRTALLNPARTHARDSGIARKSG